MKYAYSGIATSRLQLLHQHTICFTISAQKKKYYRLQNFEAHSKRRNLAAMGKFSEIAMIKKNGRILMHVISVASVIFYNDYYSKVQLHYVY